MKNIVRSRDQRVVELQVETDQLREQAARQNAVISSLKKRIQVNLFSLTSGQLKDFSFNGVEIICFFLFAYLSFIKKISTTSRICSWQINSRHVSQNSIMILGTWREREEPLLVPGEKWDHDTRSATWCKVSRGKSQGVRQENSTTGA